MDKKVSCFKIFTSFPIVLNSSTGPPIFPPTLFGIHGEKRKPSSIKGCVGIQPANLPWTQADSSAISNLRLLGGQWVKESTVKCLCTPLDMRSQNSVQQNKSKRFPKWQILWRSQLVLRCTIPYYYFKNHPNLAPSLGPTSPTPQNQNPCRTWILRMASCKMSLWNTALLKNRLKLKPWLSPQCESSGQERYATLSACLIVIAGWRGSIDEGLKRALCRENGR